jgi:hypothetical protein
MIGKNVSITQLKPKLRSHRTLVVNQQTIKKKKKTVHGRRWKALAEDP